MISHIFVGVTDFDRAFRFYDAVMRALGQGLRFCERDKPWAGWASTGGVRPYLVIGHPYNHAPHHAGNGQMFAFLAGSRDAVRATYACALAHGGTCEGPPGLRPQYHQHYYGAYFRDPDGNKIGVACHEVEEEPVP